MYGVCLSCGHESPLRAAEPRSLPCPRWGRAHALSCAGRNATSSHSPVELIFPGRRLLDMLFTTLSNGCPCNDVPWEGVRSRWVEERAVCLSYRYWLVSLQPSPSSATRKPREQSVTQRWPMDRLVHSVCANLPPDFISRVEKSTVLYTFPCTAINPFGANTGLYTGTEEPRK